MNAGVDFRDARAKRGILQSLRALLGRDEIVLLMPGVAAALLQWYSTSIGVGINPDSVIYVDAAKRLAHNLDYSAYQYGVVKPLSHFPPGLPVLLGLGALAGDPLVAARWLNAGFFALTITSVVLITRMLGGGKVQAVLAGLIALAAKDMLLGYVSVRSEVVYLPLLLWLLFALVRYLQTESMSWLLIAAAAAALSTMTRFAAIVLIPTGMLVITLLGRGPRRFTRAAIYVALSALPMSVWILWRSDASGGGTGRQLAFHPQFRLMFSDAINTVAGWAFPYGIKVTFVSLLVAVPVITILLACCVRSWRDRESAGLYSQVVTVFLVTYSAFLVVSITFLDAQTRLTDRLLQPMLLAIVPALALANWRRSTALLAGWLALLVPYVVSATLYFHAKGAGYMNVKWKQASLDQFVRAVPGTIYSNAPEAIYFLTNAIAKEIPASLNRWTRQPNPDYAQAYAAMRYAVEQQRGAVIYFEEVPRNIGLSFEDLSASIRAPAAEWRTHIKTIGYITAKAPRYTGQHRRYCCSTPSLYLGR